MASSSQDQIGTPVTVARTSRLGNRTYTLEGKEPSTSMRVPPYNPSMSQAKGPGKRAQGWKSGPIPQSTGATGGPGKRAKFRSPKKAEINSEAFARMQEDDEGWNGRTMGNKMTGYRKGGEQYLRRGPNTWT